MDKRVYLMSLVGLYLVIGSMMLLAGEILGR